jgi:hypothetical protein
LGNDLQGGAAMKIITVQVAFRRAFPLATLGTSFARRDLARCEKRFPASLEMTNAAERLQKVQADFKSACAIQPSGLPRGNMGVFHFGGKLGV